MESIPLMELSSLIEYIHVKTWVVSQNTHLDMREFLWTDKTLQSIQSELLNNTSKLTEINKHKKEIPKSWKKWKMVLLTLINKRQLYKYR